LPQYPLPITATAGAPTAGNGLEVIADVFLFVIFFPYLHAPFQ
jgi:hypothetical protein